MKVIRKLAVQVAIVFACEAFSADGCAQSALASGAGESSVEFLGVVLKRLGSPWSYEVLCERSQFGADLCADGAVLELVGSQMANPSSGRIVTEPGPTYSEAIDRALSLPGDLAFRSRYHVTQVGRYTLSEPADRAMPAILKSPIGDFIRYSDVKQVVVHRRSPISANSTRDIMCPLDTASVAVAAYAQHWKLSPDGHVVMEFDSGATLVVAVSQDKSYMRASTKYLDGLAGCMMPRMVVCTKRSAEVVTVNRFTITGWRAPTAPIPQIACDSSYYVVDRRYHQFWGGYVGGRDVPSDLLKCLRVREDVR
jgi:hypothetical protein